MSKIFIPPLIRRDPDPTQPDLSRGHDDRDQRMQDAHNLAILRTDARIARILFAYRCLSEDGRDELAAHAEKLKMEAV